MSCFGIITGQHGHFDGGGVESAQVRETTVTQALLIEFHSVDVDQTEVPLFGMGPNQYVALSQIEMLHPLEVELLPGKVRKVAQNLFFGGHFLSKDPGQGEGMFLIERDVIAVGKEAETVAEFEPGQGLRCFDAQFLQLEGI